ncbi:MAG: efflux RND transporter periplasmic adaptor subunit [Burkholderiales bacterium]|nr:efflux RND transporter periplasmic adaptor subunit [Burkholderiales bacterium]
MSDTPKSVAFYVTGVLLIAAAAGFTWKYMKARDDHEAAQRDEKAKAAAEGPSLPVAKVQLGAPIRKLVLSGEAVPLRTVTLYAKTSGYLTTLGADIGDTVKAGQVLATITSPELDAQIATLTTALDNKRRILQRQRELVDRGFISRQALDNAESDVRVAEAQIAEVRTLTGYRTLRAPFAGVVTQRYADVGALVTNATSNQTAALPVMTVADVAKLKVAVYVEQADAPAAKPGLDVEIVDAASPDRRLAAKITRVSGELDARTRTLRAEVEFDNADHRFVSGSFVNVALLIPVTPTLEVPAGALVTRDRKPYVAAVDATKHIHYMPIVLSGTDGRTLKIASGVEAGTLVAIAPPATLPDGAKIDPQIPPAPPAAVPPSGAPAATSAPAAAPTATSTPVSRP